MRVPLDDGELILAFLSLLAAGLVKGVTGIGYATCAMPLLAMSVGLEKALALVVVPALVSNVAVLFGSGDVVRTLMRFQRFYLAILPGIAVGTALLGLVDAGLATKGLAVLTLAYVVLAVAKPALSLPPALERPLAMPAGLVNGLLTGLTGSQIVPLVPYMMALRLDANTQALAINLAVTIASLALGGALAFAGIMTSQMLALSAAGALPAIAGTLAGNTVRGSLPVDGVRRLTLGVLVIAAIGLAGRDIVDAAAGAACEPARLTEPATGALAEPVARCLAALRTALASLQSTAGPGGEP